MSSPACADGYDTPAQQREDSTTFMVAKVSWMAHNIMAARTAAAPDGYGPIHSDDALAALHPALLRLTSPWTSISIHREPAPL